MVNKFFIAALFLAHLPIQAENKPAFGFVDTKDGVMYLHTSAKLESIDILYMQFPAEKNKCCLRVTRDKISRPKNGPTESDRVTGDDKIFIYAVSTPRLINLANPFIGMALINVKQRIFTNDVYMRGYVHSKKFLIQKCIASEGVNLNRLVPPSFERPIYYNVGYGIDLTAINGDLICK